MANPKNHHKNIENDELHNPKDFSTAADNTHIRKGINSDLEWGINYWDEPIIDFVDGALVPPTENAGDRYVLLQLSSSTVNADWDSVGFDDIAFLDSTSDLWAGYTPTEGHTVHDDAQSVKRFYDGNSWVRESGGLIEKEITLTSAQILAINTTPITVIPAPGSGFGIEVLGCVLFYDFVSAAYNIGASGDIGLYETNSGGTQIVFLGTVFDETLILVADTIRQANLNRGNIVDVAENVPLVATCPTGDPTLGDSTIKISILYRIFKTS